jgi:hypothetical protein
MTFNKIEYRERLIGWEFIGYIITLANIDDSLPGIPDDILDIIYLKYDSIKLTVSCCDFTLDTRQTKIIIYILYRKKKKNLPHPLIYIRLPSLKTWLKSIGREDYKFPVPYEMIFY